MGGSVGVVKCLLLVVCAMLLGASAVHAKPIPLSKPFDLKDKRVIVVAAMGHLASTTQTHVTLGTTLGFHQRFFTVASIDLDSVVAREAAATLETLGARPEIVALEYRDDDLYDIDTIERARDLASLKAKQRTAWASVLLRQHAADAVLFLHAGERYALPYHVSPFRHFGVTFPPEGQPGSSYVLLSQALYIPDLDRPLVVQTAIGRAALPQVQIPADPKGSDEEPAFSADQWTAAMPSLTVAAGRVTRALLRDVHLRALSPRSSATQRRKFPPPTEPEVTFWPS